MTRIPHYLKRNARQEIPRGLIFYDTETASQPLSTVTVQAVLNFGWLCYIQRRGLKPWSEPKWHRFTSPREFWDLVYHYSKRHSRLILFAHNQSFDFTVLQGFHFLQLDGWVFRRAIIEGPPTIISARRNRKTLLILDTLNYFRMPLKLLGASIGIEKLDYDSSLLDPKLFDMYCKRDVEIIYKAMLAYLQVLEEWDLGNFQSTLASQAFTAFRHRFMQHPIFIDNNAKALALARSGYYGGRTEAYFLGRLNQPLYLLDVNSQYPHVMRNNLFPTKLVAISTRVSLAELQTWIKKWALIADVSIRTNFNAYPYRYKNRLTFPVGRFRSTLAGSELAMALSNGCIEKVWSVAAYEQRDIFTSYVDLLYQKRVQYELEDNRAFGFMVKIMLNSLYGKFGQSGRVFKNVGHAETHIVRTWAEIDADTNTVRRFRAFAGITQELSAKTESLDSHPAIAAYVTAYARTFLYELMCEAGLDNVYYVDTDSLLLNQAGFVKLHHRIAARVMGALKLEGSWTTATIWGVKDYEIGSKLKIKGISEKAIQIDAGTFQQPTFVGFRGMLNLGDLDKMLIRTTIKRLTRVYSKGTVDRGGRVTPYAMPIFDENITHEKNTHRK